MIRLTTKRELLIGKFLRIHSPLLLFNFFETREKYIFYIKSQNYQILKEHVLGPWESKKLQNFNDIAY